MAVSGRRVNPADGGAIGAAARIRALEWLLGRKALEVEILKEALSAARPRQPLLDWPAPEPDGSR